MNEIPQHLIEALAIGLFTGICSGAFGIGGGTVSTPLLRLILSIDPHVAVGTTMALVIPTSITATINYFRKKEIDLGMAKIMVLPAVIAVVLGAALTTCVHGTTLMLMFAVFVLIAGIDLSFGVVQKLFQIGEGAVTEQFPRDNLRYKLAVAGVGFFSGFLAGFYGVGGGFIFVPCLIYFFGTPIKTAFGTSLLIVASISIPGTIAHHYFGHVDFPLMLSMMCGSIPGSLIASSVALKLKDSWLRRGFGIIMLMVAIGLATREAWPD